MSHWACQFVYTRFSKKFNSIDFRRNLIRRFELGVDSCIFVDFMRCGSISRIWSSDSLSTRCLRLIWRKRSTWCFWSLLNVYAWFGEAEHVMSFKLVEFLRLIWGSGTCEVLEVGVLKESLYLQMKGTPVSIEFFSGFYELESGWFMDQS